MALIRAVENVYCFEAFFQPAVAVIGSVAISLGQCLRSKEKRISRNGGASCQTQSTLNAVSELRKGFAFFSRLDELTRRFVNLLRIWMNDERLDCDVLFDERLQIGDKVFDVGIIRKRSEERRVGEEG